MQGKYFLLALCVLLPPTAGGAPPDSATAPGRRILAVAALENYQSWDAIPDAKASADKLATQLQTQFGFALVSDRGALYNKQADLNGIQSLLGRLGEENTSTEDQVIFYFLGHGVTKKVAGTDIGFLVPFEAPRNAMEKDLLPMSTVIDSLSKIKAKDIWVILDSCRSGMAIPQASQSSPPSAAVSSGGMKRVGIILASSGRDQDSLAPDQPELTKALNAVLQSTSCDLSDEGYCSVFEMSLLSRRGVLESLDKQNLRLGDGSSQTPVIAHFAGKESDDIIIDLVSRREWEKILGDKPVIAAQSTGLEEKRLLDFETELTSFKKKYPWYSDRVEAKRTEVLRELLRHTITPVDSFRGLAMERSDSGSKAKTRFDQIYVWVPQLKENDPAGNFWIGQTEVSVEAYKRVFPTARTAMPVFYRGIDYMKYPKVNVSFQEAKSFCAVIGGELPSPTEWQYAASGGDLTLHYPWNSHQRDPRLVNMADSANSGRPGLTEGEDDLPQIERFQMYHVLGNVAEWTSEQHGSKVEIRGGSFADRSDEVDLQTVKEADPQGGNTIGFRCLIRP